MMTFQSFYFFQKDLFFFFEAFKPDSDACDFAQVFGRSNVVLIWFANLPPAPEERQHGRLALVLSLLVMQNDVTLGFVREATLIADAQGDVIALHR